jgi:hypothetical protein
MSCICFVLAKTPTNHFSHLCIRIKKCREREFDTRESSRKFQRDSSKKANEKRKNKRIPLFLLHRKMEGIQQETQTKECQTPTNQIQIRDLCSE